MYYALNYILVFLILGSSLLVNPFLTSEFFEFPKFLLLLLGVGTFSLLCILDISFSKLKKFKLPSKVISFSMILMLLANLLAFFFASNQNIALIGSPFRYQGLITNLHYLLLAAGSFYCLQKFPQIKLSKWIILSLLLTCVVAVAPLLNISPYFQPSTYGDRVFGTMGNPNYLASFIVATLPFLIFSRSMAIYLKIPAILLVVFTLFWTGSRSAWIAITASLFFFAAFEVIRFKRWKLLIGALCTLLFIVSLVFYQGFFKSAALERFSIESDQLTSAETRGVLWVAGAHLIADKPITGYGQDLVRGNIEKYLPDYLKSNEVFYVDRTHSELIDIGVTTGIFGLLGYLGLLIGSLLLGLRELYFRKVTAAQSSLLPLLIGFSALSLYNLVNFSTISTNILLYIFVGWIAAFTVSRKKA